MSASLARLISAISSPPLLAILGILICSNGVKDGTTLFWAYMIILISILPPLIYVGWLMRKKKISNFHLDIRKERIGPTISMLVSTLGVFLLLKVLNAPLEIIALVTAAIVLIILMFLLTTRWKVSAHCAATGAFVTAVIFAFGSGTALLLPAIPTVAWSRMQLGSHNLVQTVVGSAVGAVTYAATILYFNVF